MQKGQFLIKPLERLDASSAVLHFWSIVISAPAMKQPGLPGKTQENKINVNLIITSLRHYLTLIQLQ